jgi:KDO2-lipid IV(A) lauroyltransferase
MYTLVKIFSFLICLTPFKIRRVIGNLIGNICWPLVPRRRFQMMMDNIMRSFHCERQAAYKIAKESSVRFGRMFMEVLHMPKLNKDNIHEYVKLKGEENLTKALSYGRGAVLATAHTGNWELLGAALAMHGFPLVAVAQKQTNAAMDKFINEYRTLAGMHVTYKTGVREMVTLLGKGQIIGLLMDQNAGSHGIFVDFFGRAASTPQGSAALARMKNAPIVPAFITENPDGTHTAILHPIVWVDKTEDRDQDIWHTTNQLTQIIEDHIRKYPCEWFWLHDRWKTRPREDK